jgi:hypothetical protein
VRDAFFSAIYQYLRRSINEGLNQLGFLLSAGMTAEHTSRSRVVHHEVDLYARFHHMCGQKISYAIQMSQIACSGCIE